MCLVVYVEKLEVYKWVKQDIDRATLAQLIMMNQSLKNEHQ